jgi:hypothetical protein
MIPRGHSLLTTFGALRLTPQPVNVLRWLLTSRRHARVPEPGSRGGGAARVPRSDAEGRDSRILGPVWLGSYVCALMQLTCMDGDGTAIPSVRSALDRSGQD